jgi:two-component system chemotaxis response regulator CheY
MTPQDRTVLARRNFLVVDDQTYMIDVIAEMLRHYGAKDIARAETVDAAAANFGPHLTFDAVICDFNMKPINGIQFLQGIRAGKIFGAKRDQCFILLTGHGDLEVVKAAKGLDVSGYAVKPVAPDTFIKVVTRALATAHTLKQPADYERVQVKDLRQFQ